jgi:serine/threonine protein kinase
MLSDFGTSRDMIHNSRARSGNTGTYALYPLPLTNLFTHPYSLEYTSPESLPSPLTGLLQQIDSKSDMWSLGMILHKLLFFRLPYRYASDGDRNPNVGVSGRDGSAPESGVREVDKLERLEKEVLRYAG